MEDTRSFSSLLKANTTTPTSPKVPCPNTVHKHDGHTKLYQPLFMPSFPNCRGLHLMPTAPIAVHSDTCLHARLFWTPDIWTCPPLPLPLPSLALHVTSDQRSEFKVDRRYNVPIPATLGWRSRASNNIALMFQHWSCSSDVLDGCAPSLPTVKIML